MVAIGFTAFGKDWMFRSILAEIKDQTIRTIGKREYHVGDRLQLYWKMRTKDCEKIADAVCTEFFPVFIEPENHMVYHYENPENYTLINPHGKTLRGYSADELEILAERDGFGDIEEFFDYFYIKAFYNVIRWKLEKPPKYTLNFNTKEFNRQEEVGGDTF